MFSESFRDSIMARSSLEALFFSSKTRSIRVLPSGLMSFRISAVIMSRPLLSCVAIQFWFSWHGPWQYSVSVSKVWLMRATLPSLMYRPSSPRPPVVDPQMQSKNISVSDTRL